MERIVVVVVAVVDVASSTAVATSRIVGIAAVAVVEQRRCCCCCGFGTSAEQKVAGKFAAVWETEKIRKMRGTTKSWKLKRLVDCCYCCSTAKQMTQKSEQHQGSIERATRLRRLLQHHPRCSNLETAVAADRLSVKRLSASCEEK